MAARRTSAAAAVRFLRDAWAVAALQRQGLVSDEDLAKLVAAAPEWLASAIVERRLVDADRLTAALAFSAHVPVARLQEAEPAAAHFIPEQVARQYAALPLSATNRVIRLATPDPLSHDAEQALGFVAGRQVEFLYALPAAVMSRIDEIYRPERSIERLVSGLSGATATSVETLAEPEPLDAVAEAIEAPAARLVDATIADAVHERASDIHYEPSEHGLAIRYRVDGVLREVMRVPRSAQGAVVRRLKVLAALDVTDPLHPHDGRAAARVDGRDWDMRVSSIPVARHGEKVVVRLLDRNSSNISLDALGLWPDDLETINALLGRREGIVLVTGPTGSGKTTTLYAALDKIRTGGINVVTVEDPVEYQIQGVNQIQVNERSGFTFAAALRSVLRQDPDVVLLGEIRDLETAQTAWQAGLSGHFVLSTLHTNDAASAIIRLRDIGIESFKIAAALKGVLAQRLMRRVCTRCAERMAVDELPEEARPPADLDREIVLFRAKGCAHCQFTGYRGRLAIEEILTVDGVVAELIGSGAMVEDVIASGRRFGMKTLWEAGVRRVWIGETTYDEVLRVVGEPAPVATATAGGGGAAVGAAVPEAAVTAGRRSPVPGATRERIFTTPLRPAAAAVAQAPAPAAPAPPPALPTAGGPGREPGRPPLVVLADDDPSMRRLQGAILKTEGFEIAEAADGIQALEQTQRLKPSILLLDMDMPRMNGFEVLEALRQRLEGRSVPVIVVTARDDPATETRCIELGAEDFITKPLQPASLLARIRAVLRRVGGGTLN